MATLDKVISLQNQGLSDSQIMNQLRNEGVSPKEINDSVNQAKIKNAVSSGESQQRVQMQQERRPMQDQRQQMQFSREQQPSLMDGPYSSAPESPEEEPMQQGEFNQEDYQEEAPQQNQLYEAPSPNSEVYSPPQQQESYYSPQAQSSYDQNYYLPQEYYASQGVQDTETMSEIAEQVTSEKIGEVKEKVNDLLSFKTLSQDKIEDLDERLKRIESSLDKIQQAIIGKIGEFGESTEMIHQDLENLHGTMSKLMNPLVDNYNELKKLNRKV